MNLNYIRFKKVLEDIATKTTAGTPYVITHFGNLQPQSYCTKLREAYKHLKEEVHPGYTYDEYVFSWAPTKVIVRIKGTSAKSLDTFEPQNQTIKVNTTNPDLISTLCMLSYNEVFDLPLEVPGIIPTDLPTFVETTQLPHTYLIH